MNASLADEWHKGIPETIGLEEGLSQNTRDSIYKDKEGFIWIATGDGLNRYCGHEMHAGGSSISSRIARKIIDAFAERLNPNNSISLLSRREREILEQLGKGLMYQEIADLFFISPDTVRTHVRNIYEKLQVNSRYEAQRKTGMALFNLRFINHSQSIPSRCLAEVCFTNRLRTSSG